MGKTLPAPSALIFDWDNTLVNTWPTIHEALNHTLRLMGHDEWTMEKTKAHVKKSMRDAFPQLFGERWQEAAETYQRYYRSIHLDNLEGLAHARAMLEAVRDTGMYMGLVSNKRGDNLRQELDHIGWYELFDAVVGSGDANKDKPDPAPLLLALAESGAQAGENVWFIGDTTIDLDCAENAGCTAILYGAVTPESDTHYCGSPYHHHAKDHIALKELLLGYL